MTYINWIKQCVTSPKFYVVTNGELKGFFSSKRGLRQGDPLSPYLFLLVMEGFSATLHHRINHLNFTFHPTCAELQISHVIFADDPFILCGANSTSFQLVCKFLDDFDLYSGLRPNLDKSIIFFAGVQAEVQTCLHDILAIPAGILPVRYLGVPFITTRLALS